MISLKGAISWGRGTPAKISEHRVPSSRRLLVPARAPHCGGSRRDAGPLGRADGSRVARGDRSGRRSGSGGGLQRPLRPGARSRGCVLPLAGRGPQRSDSRSPGRLRSTRALAVPRAATWAAGARVGQRSADGPLLPAPGEQPRAVAPPRVGDGAEERRARGGADKRRGHSRRRQKGRPGRSGRRGTLPVALIPRCR